MSDTTINMVTLEGARLALSAGDVLAVMLPQRISIDQRDCLLAYLATVLPEGVKAIILDGGATVAAISKVG